MRYTPINRNNDFGRAYRRGKAYVHPQVVMYVGKNRAGHTRVGITASKKIGGAVVRNRARRVIRHALYQALPGNVGPYDFVFVARGQTPRLKSTVLAKTVQKLLAQTGIPALQQETSPKAAPPHKGAATHKKAPPKGTKAQRAPDEVQKP